MLGKEQLESAGWVQIHGISNDADLLEVARSLGTPVRSHEGGFIKSITPMSEAQAKPKTLSATHGIGPFPAHTDTAFWTLPCRYIVMRVVGDIRRSTTVLRFADIFHQCDRSDQSTAEHSVWRVNILGRQFYCSMRFQDSNSWGWRYDAQCMYPANSAAQKMYELIPRVIISTRQEIVNWSNDCAVVVANWRALHGRGSAPSKEGTRELHRIYVR